MLGRWLKLWLPFDSKVVLTGVQRTDASVAFEPLERVKVLQEHWTPIFQDQPINNLIAEQLANIQVKIPESWFHEPTDEDIVSFLDKVMHSSPGPDGIPYHAWRASGFPGRETLRSVILQMMNETRAPPKFNFSNLALPPKGHSSSDTVGNVIRLPADTRPLNLKNTDNKTCTAVIAEQLAKALPSVTPKSQRGFVRFRQGLTNVLDIDTSSRVVDLIASQSQIATDIIYAALLMLFDFKAAFPSVSHKFLFMMLKAAGLPRRFRNFFKALYQDNQVFIKIDGVSYYFLTVLAGVLQGCPASGSLFVIVLNPFLILLERANGVRELTRAFADDIALVVATLHKLRRIYAIFQLASKAANLRLNVSKTVFIPLGSPLTESLCARLREHIKQVAPNWENVTIAASGKYLGFQVGPKAALCMWQAAQGKWSSRALAIAAGKLAPSLGVTAYNQRAITTLGYIAQLVPPDSRLLRQEKSLNQRVYHISNHVLPKAFLYRGKEINMPQFVSLQALSYSARYRTATKTLSPDDINRNVVAWQGARSEHASLAMLANVSDRMSHWDSSPLIDLVQQARQDLGGLFPGLGLHVDARIHSFRADAGTIECIRRPGASQPSRQKIAYSYILPRLFPFTVADEIERRLLLWLPSDHPLRSCPLRERIDRNLAALKAMPKTVIVSVVAKVWLNGLPTNFRLHRPSRPCPFCRRPTSPDRLSHIVHCDVFWQMLAAVLHKPILDCTCSQLALENHSSYTAEDLMISLHILVDSYQALPNTAGNQLKLCMKDAYRRVRQLSTQGGASAERGDPLGRQSNVDANSATRTPAVSLLRPVLSPSVRMPNSFGGLN